MRKTDLYYKLSAEWSQRNERALESYKANSCERAWWRCERGHEWEATIKGRFSGHGCPYCGGRLPVKGINDAATLCPDLSQEWHPDLNNGKQLSDYGRGSEHKAWWLCDKGHVWQASIKHRANGKGCPYCNGRRPDPQNNLAAVLPQVAARWNYDRNDKGPEQYRPHSAKIVWWKCEKGHEWSESIHAMSRRLDTSGCPYCNGKRPIPGETDLATLYPDLAAEWDYERNNKEPTEYTAGSNRKVNWICPKGHRYTATVVNRTKGRGCSLCNRGWKL